MNNNFALKNFEKFRSGLIKFAKYYRVSREDAEELVNDTILKALKYFDNDKGSFESLCKVILKRKIFNFKRDNKEFYIIFSIDDENILSDLYRSELNINKQNIRNEYYAELLSGLIELLNDGERTLLEQIYKSSDKTGKISISLAANKLGIKPLEAWNIFRRIQRKAKKYFSAEEGNFSDKDILAVEEPSISYYEYIYSEEKVLDEDQHVSKSIPPGVSESRIIYNEKTNQFFNKLTPEQQEMLNSIYG